jgi:general secretion pathway protein M
MMPHLTLPDGRKGQALAIAVTIVAAVLLWLCTAAPLIDWYETRADELTQQEQLAARMKSLSLEIPDLQQAVKAAGLQSDDDQILLAGSSDVIAGANLQSTLQNLATQAGTNVDSSALLPVQQAGTLRRISMQVSVTATWPVLIALLEAIGTARPHMIVDQISLADTLSTEPSQETPLQANFSVSAFRAGSP